MVVVVRLYYVQNYNSLVGATVSTQVATSPKKYNEKRRTVLSHTPVQLVAVMHEVRCQPPNKLKEEEKEDDEEEDGSRWTSLSGIKKQGFGFGLFSANVYFTLHFFFLVQFFFTTLQFVRVVRNVIGTNQPYCFIGKIKTRSTI